LLSDNNGLNFEGGSHTTVPGVNGGLAYNGCINLLPSASGEETGGLVFGNGLHSYDQDASAIGILIMGSNATIIGNVINGMQREGISLTGTSMRNTVDLNIVEQCSGASVGVYSGLKDLGTENILGEVVVRASEASRRHLHGVDASGIRTTIKCRPTVTANSYIGKKLNIGSGGSYGIATSLTPTNTMLTYDAGDSIELLEAVGGAPRRTHCPTGGGGTVGTLAITATAAAGTSLTAVSNTNNLRKGQWLLIAGDGTKRRIVAISGTTVTLGSATTASGTGLAVSWAPPVFKAEAALAA
jgi:hypothetical protein